MAYPERLLGDDEEVVLDLHAHWITLVRPVAVLLVVVALASFGAASVDSSVLRLVILAVGLVLVIWGFVLPWLRWVTTSYIITSERVVLRAGIIAREGRDIPLQRMNDVTFHHSVVERFLGSGTLTIESAGERGQVVLADVPHVESVQSTLYRLAEEDDIRRRRLGAEG